MQLPPSLHYNDKAVILSPSGDIDSSIVKDAASVIEGWGLTTSISDFALNKEGRFSGTVEQRLYDLQLAFDDPKVKLIFCSRGGYGIVHLLDKLNFSIIKKYPKWVIGYSDITALHAALQYNGIASIHGPMAKHYSVEGSEDISVRYTKSILAGQQLQYVIPVSENSYLNRIGFAEGRLFGGNLSVFCGILGSKFARIPFNGILFIEDIGEVPYKVDRMINQLKLAGVFNRISGLIIGKFTEYDEDNQMYMSLYESIYDSVKDYSFPVCFDFPVGHVKHNFPIIMGEIGRLDVSKESVLFKQ